ncbi:ATP-binding protein [Chryseosolibacter indicus]|uniref:DNA polymerase III subunit delta n=1 Tax=Chryseosolibacter indicus TaxID=2782351 RepID=A0ABS5VXT2_9BACT|nr:DNA polymerase III subunit delta [Chryseosolibacter indicus]MBT1704806.1 DNA polymerase III subunit delta [Chryseosolibacter indicus]
MKFSDIPGLQDCKKVLTDAVTNHHAAHAQLFVGAEGALNLPLALAYATYLHCENRTDEDACGTCAACSKNAKFVHPDTHFVFPLSNVKGDKDEERFKADILKLWRSFLLEQPFGNLDDWTNHYGGEDKQALISREESREIIKTLSLKPFESKNKIMIIWQPELMHPSAANGILKILEEPPPHTFFILVTNAADKLLPTIISRTQIVTIPLLSDDELKNYLTETKSLQPSRVDKIAQLADGNINLALKLIDNEEDNNAQRFTEWMRACYKRNYAGLVTMAEDYHGLDKLSQKNLITYSINMMRETLLYSTGVDSMNRTRGDELKFVQDFSKVMNLDKVEQSFKLMNEATYHLERNGSAKMIFLDLSLKISKTLNP